MQDISPEEAEYKLDRELKLLINDPGYRWACWENFSNDSKVILAKRLWLKFTEKGQSVPDDIVKVMFDAIKKDVIKYDIDHPDIKNGLLYDDSVYELLYIAKKDLDYFWNLLHSSTDSIFANVISHRSDILDILRKWLPEKRKFKPGEIYAIFEGLLDEPPNPKIESSEAFQQRFRHWKDKNIKPFKK